MKGDSKYLSEIFAFYRPFIVLNMRFAGKICVYMHTRVGDTQLLLVAIYYHNHSLLSMNISSSLYRYVNPEVPGERSMTSRAACIMEVPSQTHNGSKYLMTQTYTQKSKLTSQRTRQSDSRRSSIWLRDHPLASIFISRANTDKLFLQKVFHFCRYTVYKLTGVLH
jgi:hypothetical protein